jgi:hypothetical protein
MSTIYIKSVEQGCSELTKFLAFIGGAVIVIAVYFLFFLLIKELYLAYKGKKWSELSRSQKDEANLYAGFWVITVPLTIAVGLVFWIGKWIILPFIAATKKDLRDTEERLTKKIIINNPIVRNQIPSTKFVVGDLIAGIKGNPDNYKHLDEGSISKVLTIDERGRMTIVLVDHKDFMKHKDQIGKVFKAPARNFIKYTTQKKKRR